MTGNTHTRIKKLSPLLINQLAAGEVVTRPAAVVKELLENAIDAGATHIEVRITQGGMGTIEVIDNGDGIHPDDMVMAITRHATSKIADVANLQGITTLGFRGEALAATAAVSRLTLSSSHDDSGIGRQISVVGVLDDTPPLTPVVREQGTTVTVKDLYFNVPARRGNLKSVATEFTHIEAIVRDVALACADISLDLFHDNKKRLSLQARMVDNQQGRLPLSRLEQALGRVLTDRAQPLTVDLSSLIIAAEQRVKQTKNNAKISGWIWSADEPTLPKLIYVNGRLIKEALISNELRKLALRFSHEHLGYALYFELPAIWLNINVHPSKQRIKIGPLNNIMAHLTHSISSLLATSRSDAQAQSMNTKVASTVTRAATPVHASHQNTVQTSSPRSLKRSDYKNSNAVAASIPTTNAHVAAPKQSYQSSNTSQKQSSQDPSADLIAEIPLDAQTLPKLSAKQTALLPQCLAVIDTSNIIALHHKQKRDELPLLLFMRQGQFLLVSERTWRTKMTPWFDTICATLPPDANTKQINQHIFDTIARLSVQGTQQDINNFIHSLEDLLTNNPIARVNTEQMANFMLSSAHEY